MIYKDEAQKAIKMHYPVSTSYLQAHIIKQIVMLDTKNELNDFCLYAFTTYQRTTLNNLWQSLESYIYFFHFFFYSAPEGKLLKKKSCNKWPINLGLMLDITIFRKWDNCKQYFLWVLFYVFVTLNLLLSWQMIPIKLKYIK